MPEADRGTSMGEVGTVALAVHYRAGHSYDEVWEPLEIYCPECGEQRVWRDTSEGDYYVGPTYLCSACGACGQILFDGARCSGSGEDDYNQQRLVAIRAALHTGEGVDGD